MTSLGVARDGKPLLTVILATPDHEIGALVSVMRCIGGQSIAQQIEVIAVAPATMQADIPADAIEPLFGVKLLRVPCISNLADAVVPALEFATAEVVVMAEDHAYPAPGWAEALLAAHAQGWDVVGPVIANANPRSGMSWTHLVMDYGRWMLGSPSGQRVDLPGHNSTYKREVFQLLNRQELYDRLVLCEQNTALRSLGARLYLQSEAVVWHQHPSRFLGSCGLRIRAGRMFGARRVEENHWNLPRRVVYVFLWPILLVMRLKYVLQSISQAGQWKQYLRPRIFTSLMFGVWLGVVGEAVGYLRGFGTTIDTFAGDEFHRLRQMSDRDVTDAKAKSPREMHIQTL
ncbi:MAG TPA: glycosyltransferase [Tepidisphaeraceae bacterium]|nr:glycosyltransferase [Tepidisphaeraceae bacterium]